ncbi:hypothetical protein FHS23_001080 [Prauserella isguenensis]|uniref:Cation transport protein n=1 Tax=Prauserella isguenensis TaxID=1470180 RepID=A0A839RY07_9PSEU|nr:hypothetical protein [Prauserella isguenensis]
MSTPTARSTPSGPPTAVPNTPREVLGRLLTRLLPSWRQPARVVVAGFAVVVACGTALLALPSAAESGEPTGLVEALFTSVSALCVTGLIVVDTPEHWSTFGEVVILGLIQLGGIGIMTTASLLGLLVSRRFGLRMRLTAQAETKALELGDVRRVVRGVITVSLLLELIIATLLAVRFATGYGYEAGRAAYHGVFTRSRRSTTPGSPCTATASWGSRPTRGSACRSCSRCWRAGWDSPCGWSCGGIGGRAAAETRCAGGRCTPS